DRGRSDAGGHGELHPRLRGSRVRPRRAEVLQPRTPRAGGTHAPVAHEGKPLRLAAKKSSSFEWAVQGSNLRPPACKGIKGCRVHAAFSLEHAGNKAKPAIRH